jgi:hypothetical protein
LLAAAARKELALAAKLAPDSGRYSYVYVVRLNSAGKRNEALSAPRARELERGR